jgi:predicted TPR repeat methyltransferase
VLVNYERLSRVYDLDWSDFSPKYTELIKRILDDNGIAQAKILDLACGTGILAKILSNNGHQVHGIDISPQMIEIARKKSTGLPDTAFQVQNMTKFFIDKRFDLITCVFDSINYVLDPSALRSMFTRVHSALNKHGFFLFDSNTHSEYKKYHETGLARVLGEERFTQSFTYDRRKRNAATIFEFLDGAVEVHNQRPYDRADLKPFLKKAGFKKKRFLSLTERRKHGISRGRLVCLAQKKD